MPLSASSLTRELFSFADNPELQRRIRCGAENSHARQDRTHRPSSQKRHNRPGLSGKYRPLLLQMLSGGFQSFSASAPGCGDETGDGQRDIQLLCPV